MVFTAYFAMLQSTFCNMIYVSKHFGEGLFLWEEIKRAVYEMQSSFK
jgi:hypothetical protein